MSDRRETTLEDARRRLRSAGMRVPAVVLATAVTFGGLSTVVDAVAAAEPPAASDDSTPRSGSASGGYFGIKGKVYRIVADAKGRAFVAAISASGKEGIPEPGPYGLGWVQSGANITVEAMSAIAQEKADWHANPETLGARAEQARNKAKEAYNEVQSAEEALKKARQGKHNARGKGGLTQRRADKAVTKAEERVNQAWQDYGTRQGEARDLGRAETAYQRRPATGPKSTGDDGDASPQGVKPTKPPKGGPSTTGKTPGTSAVTPKLNTRIGRGGGGAAALAVLGELAGQKYQDYLSAEHQKVLAKAVEDPKLRKSIVDYYNGYTKDNPFGQLIRPFQKTGFSHGAAMDTAPSLIEFQKKLDAQLKLAKDRAATSNADPAYQQAYKQCKGENTCTTDRTRVLRAEAKRAQNRDAQIADKKAESRPVVKSERQRHIAKQEELDRRDREQFGKNGDRAVKKVQTERQRHIAKQEQLDKRDREQFGKNGDKAVKKVQTERQRHIAKQEQLDKRDREQLGTKGPKATPTPKPVASPTASPTPKVTTMPTPTPTGKADKKKKNNNPQYQAALKKQGAAA